MSTDRPVASFIFLDVKQFLKDSSGKPLEAGECFHAITIDAM